jgi:hypothetical protein
MSNACNTYGAGFSEELVSWCVTYPWLSRDHEVSGKTIDTEDCCTRHLQKVANREVEADVDVIPG